MIASGPSKEIRCHGNTDVSAELCPPVCTLSDFWKKKKSLEMFMKMRLCRRADGRGDGVVERMSRRVVHMANRSFPLFAIVVDKSIGNDVREWQRLFFFFCERRCRAKELFGERLRPALAVVGVRRRRVRVFVCL